MFFSAFPKIYYSGKGGSDHKVVSNLLRRVGIRAKVKANTGLFDTYDIKEGETPEIIADMLYDDPELHWVILLMNNVTDRYHQWPKNTNQFLAYINDKYSNVDATHHYEISQVSGDTTIKIDIGTDNTGHSGASVVTNFEYEEALEDKKRNIRLLDPSYIGPFVAEFESLMEESVL